MIKISIKNIYLILIISIGLIVLGIGSSYAMFTASSNIDNPISLSSNLITNEDIFESFNVNLSSRESRSIKFNITNSNNISNIKYASWYIYNGDSNDISFYIDKTNDNYIDFNGELSVNGGIIAIDIINNTSNNISLTIGVSSRKNNIILPSYMKLISGDNKPEVTSTYIADYITNLYTNASKSTVTNNSITYNYASSVSLMNDRLGSSSTDIDGGNIRYYGASPNNYIYFNCSDYNNQSDTTCEKWRIIGVFGNQVKIMRNEQIGKYSWNTNTNEWPEAKLMKLLNPGYDSETSGGSLYYNSKSGKCYTSYSSTKSCDFTSTGIKNDATKNKIAEVTWNLGGWNNAKIFSNEIYGYERGDTVYSGRSKTWPGRIALPYPSDYGYATDFNKCTQNLYNYRISTDSYACRTNDWMYPIITNSGANTGWLLTPDSGNASNAWNVNSSGYVYLGNCSGYCVSGAYGVAPTLYLNAGEYFGGGDGSSASPYQLRSSSYVTLTNLGLSVDTSHTPDFTTVSGNSGVKYTNGSQTATGLGDGTNGVYVAEDDLGNSYYFRGNVDNNYVYFAKNWWRIIRINGDGTIRMIYTGNPNDSSSQEYISESAYNSSSKDNAYVGYMYGSAGSSTYEATHANTNDSTIKEVVDTWYQNNLHSYSQYIADAIYCNDREVVNFTYNKGTNTTTYNGNGAATNESAYASLKRNHIEHNLTLKCTNTNDKFTVSNTLGNGALTNPIGLPTTDEIVMSGASAYDYATNSYIQNNSYYLYPKGGNYWYWTMTPNKFAGGRARVDFVSDGGNVVNYYVISDGGGAVRPVVSLKSDAISGGAGTVGNPFYVNEEYSAS